MNSRHSCWKVELDIDPLREVKQSAAIGGMRRRPDGDLSSFILGGGLRPRIHAANRTADQEVLGLAEAGP